MTMVGADVAQLRELAAAMKTAAGRLGQTRKSIDSLVRTTTWSGADRTEFAVRWTRELGPSVQSARDSLDEASRSLDKNANEQEWASQNNGGDLSAAPTEIAEPSDALPGDLGGKLTWEDRGRWAGTTADPEQAGRDVVARALEDTADQSKIAPDEFEIIALDNGKYIVVLPGVTDLSAWGPWAIENVPHILAKDGMVTDSPWGLDPTHRSVRDLDAASFASATGADVDANLYAQYVQQAMERYGVPPGSDVTLIGHSFGADTAVDLAADSNFNGGAEGYNVTHVLAAGYNSKRDIGAVPSSTNVLAIQNNRDVAAIVERAGQGPMKVIDGMSDTAHAVFELNPKKYVSGMWNSTVGIVETGIDVVSGGVDFAYDQFTGFSPLNPLGGTGKAVGDLITLDTGTHVTDNGQVNIVFEGGGAGAGHHPSNYVDYITATDSPEVAAFNTSLAEAGYTGSGNATAHDVSVPE